MLRGRQAGPAFARLVDLLLFGQAAEVVVLPDRLVEPGREGVRGRLVRIHAAADAGGGGGGGDGRRWGGGGGVVVAGVGGGGRVAVCEARGGPGVVAGGGGVGVVRVEGGIGGFVRVVAVGAGGGVGGGWDEGGRRGGERPAVGAFRTEWFFVGLLGL